MDRLKIKHIALFLMTFGAMTFNRSTFMRDGVIPWYACLAFGVLTACLAVIRCGIRRPSPPQLLMSLFTVICFASCTWAMSLEMAVAGSLVVGLSLLYLLALSLLLRERDDYCFFAKCIVASSVLMILYLGLIGGFGTLLSLRSNEDATLINANELGIKCILGAFLAYELSRRSKRKGTYCATFAFLIVFAFVSGSRKVLLMGFLFFAIPFVLRKERGRIWAIFVALTALVAMYFVVTTVPFLYEMIGSRLDETFAVFGTSDFDQNTSAGQRMSYVDLGIALFQQKPMLGYGIANAAFYNGVYLHNNYMELLVDVGLIGTLPLYLVYAYSLLKNWRSYKSAKDPLALVFFVATVVFLFTDMFVVSYMNRTILSFVFVAAMYGHYTYSASSKFGLGKGMR